MDYLNQFLNLFLSKGFLKFAATNLPVSFLQAGLEKEPENTKHLTEITKNSKNFVENDGKNSRDDKRPSSPPKLNRFDSDPPMPTLSTGRFLKYVIIKL